MSNIETEKPKNPPVPLFIRMLDKLVYAILATFFCVIAVGLIGIVGVEAFSVVESAITQFNAKSDLDRVGDVIGFGIVILFHASFFATLYLAVRKGELK